MAHFAEIDNNGIVKRVIVAEQDFIDSGAVGDPNNWIQTSYNTFGGEHKLGGVPMRMNFAGKDFKYDRKRDAFIPPAPYKKWKLDSKTLLWQPPIPYPKDGKIYKWDDNTINWIPR